MKLIQVLIAILMMVVFSLAMPITAVCAFHLIASAFDSQAGYISENAVSDLLFGLISGYLFYFSLQRSLFYRNVFQKLTTR